MCLTLNNSGGKDVKEYTIQPWDNEDHQDIIDLDMWVPLEIDELATQVIDCYDMKVLSKILVTAKSDKGGAIWKIETDKGPRSLKVLHRKPARSLFSVGAQDYIVKQGGRVPELKQTKNGLLYVEKGGKLWIVTDWIEPLTPAMSDLEGAQALCYGLGEFHRHSRGYTPPPGSERASRLYRWPDYYRKITSKIDWFRNVAQAYNDLPGSRTLLSVIDKYKQEAHNVLSFLEQSSYAQMAAMGEQHWGLVHQDFGWSNGQLGEGGLWVIDLDGVSYDLPIRDLRKLISSTMFDLGSWDITWIRGMIDAYHSANPLDLETYEILLNDLAFPNEFYKHINEMLFDPLNFLNLYVEPIIQRLELVEKSKAEVLAELKRDSHKYESGNYASMPIFEPEILEMMQIKATSEKTTLPNIIKDNSLRNPNMIKGSSLETKTKKKSKKKALETGKSQKKSSAKKNENVKILMICTEKLPVPPVRGGAIQTYIQGISGILAQKHDLTILGTTDSSLPIEGYQDNIRYVRVDGEKNFEIYAEKVIDFLKEESFDLIHVFNRPRLIPLIREVAPDSRLILSMHNDMFNTNKILQADAIAAIDEVERIFTVSDYVGNTIVDLYPQAAEKVQTIYSGVNLEAFVPWEESKSAAQIRANLRKEYSLENKKVILFVGRLTPKKGTDLLIQALKELYAFDSSIALVIVGGTWYSVDRVTDYVAYVRSLAERAPFPVISTGYVPADRIHQWFWAGDIFVCPSQWQEPLARVHYEAMAAGLPFVTTARGGNPEVVIGENGLLVEQPEDPIEFAEKFRTLVKDARLRQRMGLNGRDLAVERFSWERVANEVSEAWKGIIDNEMAPKKVSGKAKEKEKALTKDKTKAKAKGKSNVKARDKSLGKNNVNSFNRDKSLLIGSDKVLVNGLDKGIVKSLDKPLAKNLDRGLVKGRAKGLAKDDREVNNKNSAMVSSVVKITRDMISRPKGESNSNSTSVRSSSLVNGQNEVVPKRANSQFDQSDSKSVIKVTRGMIHR